MKWALYTLAILLTIGWVLGFFIYNAGTFIHVLMMLAVILCIQAVISNPKSTSTGYAEK